MAKSFREFLAESSKEHPLISSMQDMLGISPEDLKKEPQLASFFKISQGTNLGSYKIVEFKRDSEGNITHAVLEPLSFDKVYKDKDGSFKRIPEGQKKRVLVAIKDLDSLMGQDFSSNQQSF